MDLGLRLLQANIGAIYKPWLLVVIPVCVLVHLALWFYPGWALVVVWWLNPLFAHIPLVILSRRLFGDTPTTRQSLRLTGNALRRDWFAWLTIRRFSLRRSFVMPVSVLEGLSGQALSQRISVLVASKDGGDAIGLTAVCWGVVCAIVVSVMGLIELLHAPSAELLFDWFNRNSQYWLLQRHLLDGSIILLAWLIVEPLFVAAGFALYLNRRTTLEGWDIELGLRTMAARLAARTATANHCHAQAHAQAHTQAHDEASPNEHADAGDTGDAVGDAGETKAAAR